MTWFHINWFRLGDRNTIYGFETGFKCLKPVFFDFLFRNHFNFWLQNIDSDNNFPKCPDLTLIGSNY